MSDIEGKVTRVGARMEPRDASTIDGQTERSKCAGAHESKRGQRTSFNGANGMCDMAGKAARVAASAVGRSRDTKKKLYELQSKKNAVNNHFMPSLIRKLFHKSEAPKDGLTQPQREAIVDLLNYCMYADNLVFLAEDRLITDTVAKFNWDPKIPFDQFDVRSIDNARNATESQVYRDQFLASIRDRLGTAAVKGQALDLCQELFVADGARSEEEDAVLQNLRKLLE